MSVSSEPAPDNTPHLALWHNRDFRLLWAGHTISMIGSQITAVAIPLIAALTLHATPAQMAFLLSLGYAPATLISLFAGVLVDRVRRRTGWNFSHNRYWCGRRNVLVCMAGVLTHTAA